MGGNFKKKKIPQTCKITGQIPENNLKGYSERIAEAAHKRISQNSGNNALFLPVGISFVILMENSGRYLIETRN